MVVDCCRHLPLCRRPKPVGDSEGNQADNKHNNAAGNDTTVAAATWAAVFTEEGIEYNIIIYKIRHSDSIYGS